MMKKICIFDTSVSSTNIGDQIIMESLYDEMKGIFENNYCIRIATHQPICHFYQDFKRNPLIRHLYNCDYKFIGGSNVVLKNMFLPLTQWNINVFNCNGYRNSILLGCGLYPNSKHLNLYTKVFYKKVLSKKYIHSVRDENTKVFIEKLGFKAINTGCPTLWSIDKQLCESIPTEKSNSVVFTLTDYDKNSTLDKELIQIIRQNYENIYFFPQGIEDLEYLKELTNISGMNILSPNLQSYKKLLESGKIDYVGTRLHAGIYAIRHGVRSLIISIDNRARDMKNSYNLNCLDRENITQLDEIINSRIVTNITIDSKKIETFKKQFEK